MQTLEERLTKIEERNKKVELDKAWEKSTTRIITISIFTYIIASFALRIIGAADAYLGACIPVLGFILSAQSLPIVKKYWMNKK